MTNNYSKFDVWKEYEKIAMHFNDLLMQLRLRALAATGFIVMVGGFAAQSGEGQFNWALISLVMFSVLLAWISIFAIDWLYYSKLLSGAVDAIVELEALDDRSNIPINISTNIQSNNLSVTKGNRLAVKIFYFVPGIGMILLLFISLHKGGYFPCG